MTAKTTRSEKSGRPTQKEKNWTTTLWENVKSLGLVLIIVFFLRSFIIEATVVPTGSMEKTILVGDHLFLNKMLYGPRIPLTEVRLPAFRSIRRGEIVAFRFPLNPSVVYVKRLIGLPGDTIEVRNKVLYVNGQKQDEPYVAHSDPQTIPNAEWVPAEARVRDHFGPATVPPHHYFFMGDNRDSSYDSRFWGYVDEHYIVGEPLFIYWSFDAPTECWTAQGFNRQAKFYLHIVTHFFTKTRWRRTGTVL